MKSGIIKLLSVIIVLTLLNSCKKKSLDNSNNESTTADTSVPLVFTSLTTKSYTINLHATADVVAEATGSGLTYTWNQDLGTLIGSGSKVMFNGCCSGDHTITCTVADDHGNSESKSISIYVNP